MKRVGLEGRGVRAVLLGDEGRRLRDAEGTALDFACRISGREIGVQFAAVVVEAAAAAHHELGVEGGRLPGKAQARSNAPLAAGQGGLAHASGAVGVVAGDDETGAGNGVGGDVVAVLRGIEVDDIAVLLRQAAIPVVANTGCDAQGWGYLELVLGEQAGFIGAVIAIGVALQVG